MNRQRILVTSCLVFGVMWTILFTVVFGRGEASIDFNQWDEGDWTRAIAEEWKADGIDVQGTEVVLPDQSRADILTGRYAIEVEWASNWKEAPGQSLLYASLTNRQPAVVLLLEQPTNAASKLFLLRCKIACDKAGIHLITRDTRRKPEPENN